MANEAALSWILIRDKVVTVLPHATSEKSAIIIDSTALEQRTGKPKTAQTFEDLADSFVQQVFANYFNMCDWVNIVFDQYI